MPLAAALSIPLTSASGAPLPRCDLILVLATAVIVVSLIMQGLTLEPLVRRAGIARPDAARHEETVARLRLAEAARARLDELAAGDCAADGNRDERGEETDLQRGLAALHQLAENVEAVDVRAERMTGARRVMRVDQVHVQQVRVVEEGPQETENHEEEQDADAGDGQPVPTNSRSASRHPL